MLAMFTHDCSAKCPIQWADPSAFTDMESAGRNVPAANDALAPNWPVMETRPDPDGFAEPLDDVNLMPCDASLPDFHEISFHHMASDQTIIPHQFHNSLPAPDTTEPLNTPTVVSNNVFTCLN